MRRGFPSLWSIYLGRGVEWYSSEVPVMFDWMSRKTRANGTATLARWAPTVSRGRCSAETDTRFYHSSRRTRS